jgi:hypothetical protein
MFRIIAHTSMDRPLLQLPWPVSLLQPHDISYTEMPDAGPPIMHDMTELPKATDIYSSINAAVEQATMRTFKWPEADSAIAFFLRGCGPDTEVHVFVQRYP